MVSPQVNRATGARHALGTSVFGGMVAATVLGVLFVPVFFVGIERLTERRRPTQAARTGQELHA
jgi:uncharacterized protein (DUF2062 family)